MSKTIILTKGHSTVVDDADYEWLSAYNWTVSVTSYKGKFYVYASRGINIGRVNGKKKIVTIKMHRVIMDAGRGEKVDHWNGDTLDNQRHNLRRATHGQNIMNSELRRDNTSGFKGVFFESQIGKFRARITANGIHFEGGLFDDPVEAAASYNRLAVHHFGEFARLNIIPEN